MDFLNHASPGEDHVFADTVLAALIAWRTSDISNGTLDALLASGRLADIRDDRLRSALAGWPTVWEDAQEDESLARDFVETVLTPALLGQGVLPAAHASDTRRARSDMPCAR